MENFVVFGTNCISLNRRFTTKINTLKVLKLQFDIKKYANLIKVNLSKPLKNSCEGVDS